jgi:hypothetical protein
MQTITTIGLDIAKSVFQVHGVDAEKPLQVGRRNRHTGRLPSFGVKHVEFFQASMRSGNAARGAPRPL